MIRSLAFSGATLALAGCLVEKDVVARYIETGGGNRQDAGSDAESDRSDGEAGLEPGNAVTESGPPVCMNEAERLVVVDKDGRVARLRPDTFLVEEVGRPSCVGPVPLAAAIDRTGMLWVAPEEGGVRSVDPGSLACTSSAFESSKVTAMAFVYDVSVGQELLYLISDGILTAVDPGTLARAPIGPLRARVLTGTQRGELYALDDLDDASISIALVDLGSGTKKPAWTVERPNGWFLGGGAAHANELLLTFEHDVYRFSPEDSELSLVGSMPATLAGVVSLASSICALAGK